MTLLDHPTHRIPSDSHPTGSGIAGNSAVPVVGDPADVHFRAMGSDGHIIVTSDIPGLPERARRRVDELERRWSRFDPDSEISELNRRSGDWVTVSADTVTLIRRSIEAHHLSGGSFDPTIAGDLIRAGYDRSFERLSEWPTEPLSGRHIGGSSTWSTGCAHIEIVGTRVRLPRDTGFDPGGIGKGLAADLVVADLVDAGADGVCVNLGGDLRVTGRTPAGGAWTVAVETPEESAFPITRVGLASGAVATSSTVRRRWVADGETRHHLIDPFTGRPSTTDLIAATVVAATAWEAEVLATAVLLRGTERAFAILEGTGAVALTVDRDRRIDTSPGFDEFVSRPVPEVCP